MSDYDKRYNVLYDGVISYYTDDPAKTLSLYNSGDPNKARWISEGYGYYSDGPYDSLCITRCTVGPVLPSTLEYIIARDEVQKMIKELRSAAHSS